jgi:hypothetical protein
VALWASVTAVAAIMPAASRVVIFLEVFIGVNLTEQGTIYTPAKPSSYIIFTSSGKMAKLPATLGQPTVQTLAAGGFHQNITPAGN